MKRFLVCLLFGVFLAISKPCIANASENISIDKELDKIYEVNISNRGLFGGATEVVCKSLVVARNQKSLSRQKSELLTFAYAPHSDINYEIYKIRWNPDLSDTEKIAGVAEVFAENLDNLNITYESNGQIFGWTQLNDELVGSGIYYHDNMKFDCSGFVQYVYYIATDKAVAKSTTRQCENSIGTQLEPGVVSYCYNPSVDGDQGDNHCAIWLGNNRYIDCANNIDGLRVKDITNNEFWQDFMHYHAILLPDAVYEENNL